MRQRNLAMLVALALIWGASFMFIKVADRQLSPATLIMGRLGLAAVTLAAIVPFATGTRETVAALRENAGWLVTVALVNTAAPFWLLSWAKRGSTPGSPRSSRRRFLSSTPVSPSSSSARCG